MANQHGVGEVWMFGNRMNPEPQKMIPAQPSSCLHRENGSHVTQMPVPPLLGASSQGNPPGQPSSFRCVLQAARLPRALANGHRLGCLKGSCRSNVVWGGVKAVTSGVWPLSWTPLSFTCLEVEHLLIPRKWWDNSHPGFVINWHPPPNSICHVGSQAQDCQSFHVF